MTWVLVSTFIIRSVVFTPRFAEIYISGCDINRQTTEGTTLDSGCDSRFRPPRAWRLQPCCNWRFCGMPGVPTEVAK